MKSLLPKDLKYPFVLRIKASAGAGKTYTLMLAFLWHLAQLKPELNNLKALVALTFTNKATREMKTRILKGLKEIAKKSEQGQKLSQETGLTSTQAKNWLELILTNYSAFQVKTIDSFLFSLLTLLGLDQNWPKTLSVELKEDFFLDKILDNLLAKEDQDTLQKAFNTFLEVENPQGFYLQPKFKQRIIDLFKNSLEPVALSNSSKIRTLKEELVQKSKELLTLIYQENSSIKFKYKWDEALLNPIDKVDSQAFSKSSLQELVTKKFQNYISPSLEDIFTEIKSIRQEYLLALAKEKVRGYSELIRLLQQRLQEYQKKQGTLIPSKWYLPLLQSLNKFDLPHLFCLLGEKWKHFLIDEFQDTSLIQWQILKFFIENSLSEGGSLILVGDSKQSIYIWRDAQPELFNEVHSDFPQAHFFEQNLPYNWRSLPNIIKHNNTFFEELFNDAENTANQLNANNSSLANKIKIFYRDLTQKLAPPLNPSWQGTTKSIYLEDPEEKEPLLIKLLTNLSKTRPLKDIALLVRSNKEVNELTTLLWQHKLATISENSLNLETSFVIRGLINFLYFLDSPFTDMYLLGTLPLLNLPSSFDFDYYLKVSSDTPLFIWLKKENSNLYEHLKTYLNQAGFLSCYDLIQLFLEQEKIWTRFSIHKPFICNFLELLLMTHNQCLPISTFLELWENQKKDQFVEMPEQMEAIKVMTLHSAKGLEFPVVILPNVSWSSDRINLLNLPQIGLVRVKQPYPERILPYLEEEKAKKAIESLNLLYVGLTRAKEELYIFYQNSGVGKLLVKNV